MGDKRKVLVWTPSHDPRSKNGPEPAAPITPVTREIAATAGRPVVRVIKSGVAVEVGRPVTRGPSPVPTPGSETRAECNAIPVTPVTQELKAEPVKPPVRVIKSGVTVQVGKPTAKEPPQVRIRPKTPESLAQVAARTKSAETAPPTAEAKNQTQTDPEKCKPKKPKHQGPPKERKERKPPNPEKEFYFKNRERVHAMAKEQFLNKKTAWLVAKGEWTLERARKWSYHDRCKFKMKETLAQGVVEENALFEKWIAEKAPIRRLSSLGNISAILEEVTKFDFRWGDCSEPVPKHFQFGLVPEAEAEHWEAGWSFDQALEEQHLQVVQPRAARPRFRYKLLVRSLEKKHHTRIQLLNGWSLDGYVRWMNDFHFGFSRTLEENSPCAFILLHGIYKVDSLETQAEARKEPRVMPAEAEA